MQLKFQVTITLEAPDLSYYPEEVTTPEAILAYELDQANENLANWVVYLDSYFYPSFSIIGEICHE